MALVGVVPAWLDEASFLKHGPAWMDRLGRAVERRRAGEWVGGLDSF